MSNAGAIAATIIIINSNNNGSMCWNSEMGCTVIQKGLGYVVGALAASVVIYIFYKIIKGRV